MAAARDGAEVADAGYAGHVLFGGHALRDEGLDGAAHLFGVATQKLRPLCPSEDATVETGRATHSARRTVQLKRIDAEIRQRLQAEEALARHSEILTSIPSISDATVGGLIVHMPELGTLIGSSVASLAGLAPVTRESGSWKGRRFIQGGRHHVRRLLYMPALAAIRCNPDLKRTYAALLANGKPPKVALAAVMRKLFVFANMLIQQDRIWTAYTPGHHA